MNGIFSPKPKVAKFEKPTLRIRDDGKLKPSSVDFIPQLHYILNSRTCRHNPPLAPNKSEPKRFTAL
jgi:hypothetical protein